LIVYIYTLLFFFLYIEKNNFLTILFNIIFFSLNLIKISSEQTPSSPKFDIFQSSNDLKNHHIESALDSYDNNSFNNDQQQQQQQSVFIISPFEENDLNKASQLIEDNNNNNNTNDETNILVDPNSKLGILLQTKILEEKMQSFVTLINEKQLNQMEQKQVFDSIKMDYEMILKNYQQVKNNDLTGLLPNELDMDIDLNKELDKMKCLIGDIVVKMNTNQVEPKSEHGSLILDNQNQEPKSTVIILFLIIFREFKTNWILVFSD